MVTDNVNVPAVYEWAGRLDEGPGFLHKRFEGEVGDGELVDQRLSFCPFFGGEMRSPGGNIIG